MKVTILGAGNGGYALAFHLVQMGHEVLIHCPAEFKDEIQPVEDVGCIVALQNYNKCTAELHGSSNISKVTTNIKEALEFSAVIMLIIPSFGQRPIFEAALPYLTEAHIFISLPGNFAFLDYMNVIKKKSNLDVTKDLPFTLIETSSIPYACRKVGGNKVFIVGTKKEIQVGVYPSAKTDETIKQIKPLFSLNLQVVRNVLEVGFYNLNFILHPPILIYNAGWIEARKGDFLFYKDGGTPGVLQLLAALDGERCAIGKAIGLDIDPLLSVWKRWYGENESKTLGEFVANSKWYDTIKAPPNLNNRYITEDLNFILVPLVEFFARKYNVETPVADAIITSAKYLSGLSVTACRSFQDFPRDFDEM